MVMATDFGRAYSAQVGNLLGDITLSCVQTHGVETAEQYAHRFLRLYATAESPIESLVALHLAAHAAINQALRVEGQAEIDAYRVDFLVQCKASSRAGIVIECDGHDFHERTKEQAARDRSKDRRLQTLGYLVLRFTGSEIVSSQALVTREINKSIEELLLSAGVD